MSEGKVEEKKEAQDERAKKRRRTLSWIAAPIAAAAALAAFVGIVNWTPFWATAALYYAARIVNARGESLLFLLKRWKWGLIAVATAALGILEGPDAFEWLVGWLRRYEVHPPWAFCWRIALENMIVSIAAAVLFSVIDMKYKLGWMKNKQPDIHPTLPDYVFLAPTLETMIFQAIPIGLLSWIGASFGTQVAASAALFALAHYTNSIGSGLAAGNIGGVYFGYTYAYWLQFSFRKAFWITALSHSLGNIPPAMLKKLFDSIKKKKERHESEDGDD